MIYHRRECEDIRPWRIGVQWWHGPHLFLATRRKALRIGLWIKWLDRIAS